MLAWRISALAFLLTFGLQGFAQDNQIRKYLAKRSSITSGELVYQYRIKSLYDEDTGSAILKVKFYDLVLDGHIQTALFVEDTGMVVLYDLKKTYKFFPTQKNKRESEGKTFEYKGLRFYLPLSRENPWLNSIANDTSSDVIFSDSMYKGAKYQGVYRAQRFVFDSSHAVGNTEQYIFDTSNSIPINYWILKEAYDKCQYTEYTLLDHKFNIYDSASFFTMLADSLQYLRAACPTEIPVPPAILHDTIAPNFSYVSFTGDTVQLSDVTAKNRVVILDFWYASCMPCRESIPIIVQLYKKYKHLGLEILGIDPIDKKHEPIEKLVKQLDITYPILLTDLDLADSYRVSYYPSVIVVHQGNIVYTDQGYSLGMKRSLDEVLKRYLTPAK